MQTTISVTFVVKEDAKTAYKKLIEFLDKNLPSDLHYTTESYETFDEEGDSIEEGSTEDLEVLKNE